jgi:hypothetical protein
MCRANKQSKRGDKDIRLHCPPGHVRRQREGATGSLATLAPDHGHSHPRSLHRGSQLPAMFRGGGPQVGIRALQRAFECLSPRRQRGAPPFPGRPQWPNAGSGAPKPRGVLPPAIDR